MQRRETKFGDLIEACRFLSSSIDIYGISNERLDPAATDDRFFPFFSRSFLKNRRWTVIPLWEGNITTLLREDQTVIPFLDLLRRRCLETGGRFLHYAAIAKTEFLKSPGATALTISDVTLDLVDRDPAELFKTTIVDKHLINVPNWGDNFIWPSNERFMIYTNGDQVAFFAGDRQEILDLLGVSYDYCVRRVTEVHAPLKGAQTIAAFLSFCQEFSR